MTTTNKRRGAMIMAIAVLLLAAALCTLPQVAIAESGQTGSAQTQAVDTVGAYDSIAVDGENIDMTAYKDKPLPDDPMDEIDSGNIDEYVPKALFNRGEEPIVYCGYNYGFVIQHNGNGNNTVLLFQIEAEPVSEFDDGYRVRVSVVFEKSFLMVWNNITPLVTLDHLALGVNGVKQIIIDEEIGIPFEEYRPDNDDGPFLIEIDYGSTTTEIVPGDVGENYTGLVIDTVVDLGLDVVTAFNPYLNVAAGLAVGLAGVLIDSANQYVVHSNGNPEIIFPINREDQLNSAQTKYSLVKSYDAVVVNKDNYVLAYDDDENYLEVTFRINNPDEARYYVYNLVRMSVFQYNSYDSVTQVKDFAVECLFNAAQRNLSYMSLDKASDGESLLLNNGNNFVPLFENYDYGFMVDATGYYGISGIQGYDVVVEGNTPGENGFYYFVAGNEYNISVVPVGESVSFSDGAAESPSVYYPTDFDDGMIRFGNVAIWRNQSVAFDDVTLRPGLSYALIAPNETHNNVYSISTANTANVEMYITDDEFNILAQGQKIGGKVVVNYPLAADAEYYLVCENKTSDALAMTLADEGDLYFGDTSLDGIPMYYRINAEYTQQYRLYGDVQGIYNASCQLHDDKAYDVYMHGGSTYYVLSMGKDDEGVDMAIEFEQDVPTLVYADGQTHPGVEGYNSVFAFSPKVTARYVFSGGDCDVYENGVKIADEAVGLLMEQGKEYTLVKCDTAGTFSLEPDATAVQYGQAVNVVGAPDYSVYVFELDEWTRIDIEVSGGRSFEMCDAALQTQTLDHGYYLMAGKYYVVIAEGGDYTVTVTEYLQPIEISLTVDGRPFEAGDGVIYYGKPFELPVPEDKIGYVFDGWFDGDTAYTNASGESTRLIMSDSIALEAHWTAKGVVISIDPDTMNAAWWTGEEIVYDEPEAIQEEGLAALTLVNLIKAYSATDAGRREGYYVSDFTLEKEDSDGENQYYVLYADFQPKKYQVTFVVNDSTEITKYMTYGDVPTNDWEDEIFAGSTYIGAWDSWEMPVSAVPDSNDPQYEVVKFVQGQPIPDLFTVNTPMIDDDVVFPVVLTRNLTEVQYYVSIDGSNKKYEVGDDGYELPTSLSDFGIDEKNYYGYNVILVLDRGDTSINYTLGSTVEKTDLYQSWQEGTIETNVELALEATMINYKLTYSYGRDTEYFNAESDPIKLDAVSSRGWYFSGWTYNDQYITEINLANIGEDKVYSSVDNIAEVEKSIKAAFLRTSYDASSFNNKLTISSSVGVAYVDCLGAVVNVSGEFTITPSVDEVTFDGRGGVWRDSKIVVSDRTTPLTINFSNFSIMAKSQDIVLDARGCMDLTIYSHNEVTLTSGEGGLEGENMAVYVGGNLTLDGAKITIEGTYQTVCSYDECNYAMHGIVGGLTRHPDYNTLTVRADEVYVYGGDGGNATQREDIHGVDGGAIGEDGGDGKDGVDGGYGGYAIIYIGKLVVEEGSYLYCEGGDGGDGTDGGKGGNGGDGKNGEWFGAEAITSGDGGDGGNGGDGGDGGGAIVVVSVDNDGEIVTVNGAGGAGGAGGAAGLPGAPGYTVFGNEREGAEGESGEPGSDGAEGITIIPQ